MLRVIVGMISMVSMVGGLRGRNDVSDPSVMHVYVKELIEDLAVYYERLIG